jgi:hypothetical protein
MRKIILILILCLGLCLHAFAEDVDDLLRLLEQNIYDVHIKARVVDQGNVSVWNMDISKLTISGKTVNVKLNGNNIVVYANITPYKEDNDSILLVAQGQVWIKSKESNEVTYSSTIKSMPITTGEKVLFYPLGVTSSDDPNFFIIELEIQVLPYHEREDR